MNHPKFCGVMQFLELDGSVNYTLNSIAVGCCGNSDNGVRCRGSGSGGSGLEKNNKSANARRIEVPLASREPTRLEPMSTR